MLALLLLAAATVPSVDQSINFRSPSNPRISPDGRYVAYMVSETNWDENAFETEIWIYSATTGERYQSTSGKKSSAAPSWSPDSKLLAFLSDRDGKTQPDTISPTGGEAAALTKDEAGIAAYDWFPDGKRIAFTSTGPEDKARKDRRERYGSVAIEDGDHQNVRLWVIDATGKAHRTRSTDAAQFHVRDFAFSPDSARIAFTAARDPDPGNTESADLYVVASRIAIRNTSPPLAALRAIPSGRPTPLASPSNPPRRRVLLYKNRRIALIDADGGAQRVLATTFDENPALAAWTPAGIYFSGFERTNGYLFHLDPATAKHTRALRRRSLLGRPFSFTADWKQAAFIGSPRDAFSRDLHVAARSVSQAKRITDFTAQYKDFQLATRELVQWRIQDGALLEGVLLKPAGYDPLSAATPCWSSSTADPPASTRPPSLADRYLPHRTLRRKGALVLRPNYRGSAGYGENFRALNVRNLGVGDAWDVIVRRRPPDREGHGRPRPRRRHGLEPGRLHLRVPHLLLGPLQSHFRRRRYLNWMTYYVNTDIHPFTRQYLNATPWEDPEIYRKTSPISYVLSGQDPHADPARRPGPPRPDPQRVRTLPGAPGPQRPRAPRCLQRIRTRDQQTQAAAPPDGGQLRVVQPLPLGRRARHSLTWHGLNRASEVSAHPLSYALLSAPA